LLVGNQGTDAAARSRSATFTEAVIEVAEPVGSRQTKPATRY